MNRKQSQIKGYDMKNKLLSMLRTIGKHIVSIRFTAVIMILAASVVPLLAVRGIVVNSFLERQIKPT